MESIVPEKLDAPGTHVLVIGVSAYPHFEDGPHPTRWGELLGMAQLSSAARSASEFAAWMLKAYNNPKAPLSSLRVLLSPSAGEQMNPEIAALLPDDCAATSRNVLRALREFRRCCQPHKENVAVVHVVGHGVQLSKSGSIVLLTDCGSDEHMTVLGGAMDMASIHAAFNHADTAQNQFWFVDACRQRPSVARRFEAMQAGLKLDEPNGAAGSNAIFYAATTGEPAFARVNGISLFTESLLAGLNGAIAAAPERPFCAKWHVSTLELAKKLPTMVQALAAAERAGQTIDTAGRLANVVLHEYPRSPDVALTVAISPEAEAERCVGSLRHGQRGLIRQDVTEWPMQQTVEAGIYEVLVKLPEREPVSLMDLANPPVSQWQVEVST